MADHNLIDTFITTTASATYVAATPQDDADLFGDSITYGVGASVPANNYATLLAGTKRWTGTVTNHGVNGDQAWDQASPVFAETVATTSQSTLLIGTNDFRLYTSTLSKQQGFRDAHLALLAWLAIPDTLKLKGQNAAVTKTGTWASTSVYGGGMGVQSEVVADSVTFTANGRAVYVCSILQDSVTSSYKVTIDGRDFGTYSTGTAAAMVTGNGRTYGPRLLRFGGLSDGPHTVVVTVVTASAGNPVYFMWGCGPAGAQSVHGPRLTVGTIPRFTSAGYAASGGSDALNATYNELVVTNARRLQDDGLNVAVADVAGILAPGVHLSGDGVHPNDTGHSVIRDAFVQATAVTAYPSERRTPAAQRDFVGCKVTRSSAYNIPGGSLTAVPWDGPDATDTHGFHDPASNNTRLTIPPGQAGYYDIMGIVGQGAALADQVRYVVRARVNGADLLGGNAEVGSSGAANYAFPTVATWTYLYEGDYVELLTYNSGAAVAMDLTFSTLAIAKRGI